MSASTLTFSPGDLVRSSIDKDVGIVVSVRETNYDPRFKFPYVYYVFFAESSDIFVRFQRELSKL